MFHWYRIVGSSADGSRVLEPPGVLAAVVPAAPERSVANSVLFEGPERLAAAYAEIAAAYAEIGAKWTVWVDPEGRDEAAGLLQANGHVLDANPTAMVLSLAGGVERPPAGALDDWTSEGDITEVAAINDRSYSFDTDSFSRAFTRLPDDAAVRVYVVRQGGRPVASTLMIDHGGNSEVDLVAVVPEARGAGLAGKLLAHALADAAERGNRSATLVATPLGRPVYDRLGFEEVGRFEMWERRPVTPAPAPPRT
jgi:ribosomal protein S18 acetylase RimI-like enzyme